MGDADGGGRRVVNVVIIVVAALLVAAAAAAAAAVEQYSRGARKHCSLSESVDDVHCTPFSRLTTARAMVPAYAHWLPCATCV